MLRKLVLWMVLILCLFSVLNVKFVSCVKNKLMMKLDRMEVCSMPPNSPFSIEYFEFTFQPGIGYILNAKGKFLRDLDSNTLGVEMHVIRCNNKENLDTCEKYATLKPSLPFCQLITMAGIGFDSMFKNVHPPFKCPFKKGIKIAEHVLVMKPDSFVVFPLEHYYWKLRGSLLENGTRIIELCLEGQAVNVIN